MKNKVISLLLILLLVTSSLPALASNKIKDLPTNHWAYQSVTELVEKGYMSLYQDNKFNGNQKVSRYHLAKVIAKILNNIEQGRVAPEKEDVLTLKRLATEFRSELVQVMNKSETLESEIEDINKDQEIIKEDLIKTNDKINKLQQQVSQILTDLKEEATRIDKLTEKLSSLQQENGDLTKRVSKLEAKLRTTGSQAEVEKLKKRFYWLTGGGVISLLLLMNR